MRQVDKLNGPNNRRYGYPMDFTQLMFGLAWAINKLNSKVTFKNYQPLTFLRVRLNRRLRFDISAFLRTITPLSISSWPSLLRTVKNSLTVF